MYYQNMEVLGYGCRVIEYTDRLRKSIPLLIYFDLRECRL